MTSTIYTKIKHNLQHAFVLQALGLALFTYSAGVSGAVTDLGSAPLVTSTTSDVLPNLMYILDNSGSMSWDYMPDFVNDINKCKTTGPTGEFSASCTLGDPPYNANEFNTIYYNPAITYSPGLTSVGAEKTSMTSANTTGWTAVPIDAYGIQSTVNTSLVPNTSTTGYSDRVWCNTTGPLTTAQIVTALSATTGTMCKKNSQYIYPNNTGTTATSFNQPYTLRGYPYYYTVAPGEYCTNKNLTSCVAATAPTGINLFPATLRWCNSAARTNCQAKYLETTNYTFAKWSGITNAASATGSIQINADPLGLASPVALSVTGITVNGIRIIPAVPSPALTITNTTSNASRNTLATNIASAINAHVSAPDDFIATALADIVTITRATSGSFTGTVVVTTTSHTAAATPAVKATGSITVNSASNGTTTVGNITVNGIEIMGGVGAGCGIATSNSGGVGSTRRAALATALAAKITACTSSPNYTATASGSTVTITASVAGSASNGPIVISTLTNSPGFDTPIGMSGGDSGTPKTYTLPTTITQISGGTPVANSFSRVDIVPTTPTYAKAGTRTDCGAGSTCTYDQEMTNFANWYSYYRTRMQMMKTSTSRAFKTIDSRFRVGFITINSPSTNYLPIAQYTATQKADWYTKLLAANPGSSTPLRTALSTTGLIFAGKKPVGTSDPVQYSCQQNFAILTTDGYWNGGGGLQIDGSSNIGNYDGTVSGVQTPRPMYEGLTSTSNSLADVAKYYYDTDLRQGTFGTNAICTGSTRPDGSTGDVCTDNVFVTSTDNNIKQHMTTFTLGLGVDATLAYATDYKTATSGDFYELKQGTLDWPVPAADSQTAVDDLWHAAVNGQGTYFSAKNPNQLATSLGEALNSIKSKVGAGAAAATSTLNPVSGDNYTYVASYTSVKWTGNLEARTVNTDTGKVSEDARWCLENVVADTCVSPSSIVSIPGNSTNGNTTTYQCVTPSATAATCVAPGVLVGTDCKVEVASSCTGTMQAKVNSTIATENPDTRNIYMNVNGTISNFTSGNLATAGKSTNFGNAFLATNLSQWSSLTAAQKAKVDSSSLVNYLRGNTGFEDRASNAPPNTTDDNRLYRFRESTLGDLIDSTPVYVGVPKANFSDPGYGPGTSAGSFKTTQTTRSGTVYIGANDGMLHAINADDTSAYEGKERWAYVPSMVLDNMWKLASADYSNFHSYYMNGDIVVNDVCTANCTSASTAVWKTILVAGLNGGGKGYFALDITNPDSPQLLWEFDTADDNDIGYSYGNPIVTKKADGTWVVLLTSGYNNTTGSNPGKGFLYMLNAGTGAVITKYTTGVGDATTPSGLAKINAFVADGAVNNTAKFVYGGDLLGNVWRFDINSAQSSTNPFKVAIVKDPSGVAQPITVRPELAEINGKTILYVGTGRYLGTSDLTNTQVNTIYAISDDATGTATTLDNPRASSLMVNQVLVNDTLTATRSVQQPANTVDFTTGRGWYVDFPDSGERQNVPAQLVFGTLLLPTTIPSNTVCSPGGTGWLNFLDYRTGAAVSGNVVASKTNAPIVGINVLYVKGKPVVNIVTADNPTPQFPAVQPPFTGGSASGFTNHRVIWRELIDEQ